jgi:hypothetical protein
MTTREDHDGSDRTGLHLAAFAIVFAGRAADLLGARADESRGGIGAAKAEDRLPAAPR